MSLHLSDWPTCVSRSLKYIQLESGAAVYFFFLLWKVLLLSCKHSKKCRLGSVWLCYFPPHWQHLLAVKTSSQLWCRQYVRLKNICTNNKMSTKLFDDYCTSRGRHGPAGFFRRLWDLQPGLWLLRNIRPGRLHGIGGRGLPGDTVQAVQVGTGTLNTWVKHIKSSIGRT